VFGLVQLLERSGAKRLALDSLTDRDASELTHEREQLRKVFDTELPSAARIEQVG